MYRVLAAFMFFTRLPLWRYANVPAQYFSRVVELWPLVGWFTGGCTALILFGASHLFTQLIAIIIAVVFRMLLTGALHEDGLADFMDGFGGGVTRERILAIMKDSHIGTYGVIGLGAYLLLLIAAWWSLPISVLVFVIPAGDAWSKFCSAHIVNFLPYARKEQEAKIKTAYLRFGFGPWLASFVFGALPMLLLPFRLWWAAIAPVAVAALLILWMKHRIGGYTGDCCGATFLMSELSFYLCISALWN